MRVFQLFSVAVLLQLVFSSALLAAPPKVKVKIPDNIKGATTIDSEGLIALSQSEEALVVVDSRITEDRAMGHIEDSLSLADINTSCKTLNALVANLRNPIAFYCNGPECGRSVKATRIAVQCGYLSVYWFKGGFAEWKKADYPYVID